MGLPTSDTLASEVTSWLSIASTNLPTQVDTAGASFNEDFLSFGIDRNIAHLQSVFDAAMPDIPTTGSLPPPHPDFSTYEIMQISAVALASIFVVGVNLLRALRQ